MLVTVGCVGLVAILVDVLGVSLRLPLLAGLPLLAVYAFPAAVVVDGVTWWLFPIAASGWIGLLAVSQRDSVRSWSTSRGVRVSTVGSMARRAGAAAIALAVAVPLLIPGLTERVIGSGLGGAGTPFGGGGQSAGDTVRIDPFVSMRRGLLSQDDREVLRYRSTSNDPVYLRLVALTHFDGVTWQEMPPDELNILVPISDLLTSTPDTRRLEQVDISIGVLDGTSLPLPAQTTALRPTNDRAQSTLIQEGWVFDNDTGTASVNIGSSVGLEFVASTTAGDLAPAVLNAATRDVPSSLQSQVRIPDDLPLSVVTLTRKVTSGAQSPFERAVALQSYFTEDGGFRYSTQVLSDPNESFLEQFLTDRAGYCQQFAGAMAVMARIAGIPARVIIGFSPGTRNDDGSWSVSANDAHAWPELWFDTAGWVRFEPTPRVDATSGVNPPPYAPRSRQIPTPADRAERAVGPDPGEIPAVPAAADPDAWRRVALTVSLLVGLLAALIPAILRRVRRSRRLAQSASAEDAWDEVRDAALDLNLPWNDADSPRTAGARLVTAARLPATAQSALEAVVHATERSRYSAQGWTSRTGLADDVSVIREAMVERADRRIRLRAVLWPRSVLRKDLRRGGDASGPQVDP
jgi:transglutaminase-like putative cysteine protease